MSKSARKIDLTPTEKVAIYESLLMSIDEATWNKEKLNDYIANISDWAMQRKLYYSGEDNTKRVEESVYNLLKTNH